MNPPASTSLSRNVLTSFVGQVYVAAIGLVMVPVYLGMMGAEAYGLVAFFTVLQTWFQLLDLGITPTFSRELSRFRAGAGDRAATVVLVRTLEWFCGLAGLVLALAIALAAPWIAAHWLKPGQLGAGEVALCVAAMGGMIGLRALAGLYRGGLVGLEQVWVVNLAAMALATLRSVGVLAVLWWWTTRPGGFFLYQLALAGLELALMAVLFRRAFPLRGAGLRPDPASLRRVAPFAGGMAVLAVMWIVISQTDKLVLSWLLDLEHFGFFMIAATLAGGIPVLAAPVNQALQPRFAVLVARGEHERVVALLRASTQLLSAGLFAVAGAMACFAQPLLLAWTGDATAAREGAGILPQYAVGNAFAGLLALAFLVQFAHGTLRAQIVGNCIFSVLWIPGLVLAASRGGASAAGWVWCAGNLLFLVLWVPAVFRRLLPGLGWRWLACDIGLVAGVAGLFLAAVRATGFPAGDRWAVLAGVALVTMLAALLGALACPGARGELRQLLDRMLAGGRPALGEP